MATLREYFDTDFSRVLSTAQPVHWVADGEEGDVSMRIHMDFDSNTKFLSAYLPPAACRPVVVNALIDDVNKWLAIGAGVEVHAGLPGERMRRSRELRFAGRLFLYHEGELPDDLQEAARARALAQNVALQFRGPTFAEGRSRLERPLAFVSHDSRDKDAIARPIAVGLAGLMLTCLPFFGPAED